MNPIDSDGWFGPHGTNRRTIKAERKRMNLIEEVLKVEANYRSALDAHMASGSFRTEAAANNALGRLKDVGRTAAPKLARALMVALDLLRSYRNRDTEFERITGEAEHTVARCEHAMNICRHQRVDKILAEIEKEIAPTP